MVMVSSEYQTCCSVRKAQSEATVNGPIRPVYMINMTISLLAGWSCGVMPVDRPTVQQRDDKSFLDDFSGHSAPERRGHPPGSRAARRLQKSEQRSGFYAASGGAGRRAYEHEKDQNKQAGVSERTDRIGGKTGRSSRNALKECAQPCDVFRRFQKQRAQKDQYRAHHDDDFGVQSQRAGRTVD